MDKEERAFYEKLEGKGVSRRDFMKFCTFLTATMGLSSSFVPKVAEVFAQPAQRPPVIWLAFGRMHGVHRGARSGSMYPWIDQLVLEVLDIDYHETIMAAGRPPGRRERCTTRSRSTRASSSAWSRAPSPPSSTARYGKVGGKTFLQIAKEVCTQGRPASSASAAAPPTATSPRPSPTPAATRASERSSDIKTVNIAGCPPNPINFVGTVVNYLLLGKLPALDNLGRPLFAYGQTIHDNCPRRGHFENEEFVTEFGSEEARLGYCLYKVGCRGPETYNNCGIVKFNDGTSWPVQAGHPCIGCSQPDFWDKFTPFYQEL
ncbi:MAG: hydrogenase small subunit [Desulfobacterales bacterium]|nr:hydrogenase small subunit [Desulfobacterales bacterium]